MTIETKLDRTKIGVGKTDTVHAMVSITAPAIAEAHRTPVDVCLVLDVSGSMAEPATANGEKASKMEHTKRAAQKFVDNLMPTDRIGLVVFSTNVEVLTPVASLDDAHRLRLAEAIRVLRPMTATDLVAGICRGFDALAEARADGQRTRRVLCFTDGMPTAGITAHAEVVLAVTAKWSTASDRPALTTFGFGVGQQYDPELLASLARLGGGNVYHADTPDGILAAFADELGCLRSAAASDVRIRLTTGTDVAIAEILNDLTVRTEQGVTTIDLGSLYSSETQHIVCALTLPARDNAFPRDTTALKVLVTGVTATGDVFEEGTTLAYRYVPTHEADTVPDRTVEEQRLRLKTAQEIQQAHAMASNGDHVNAVRRLRIMGDELRGFDSDASRMLGSVLGRIADHVGDSKRFAASQMHIKSAARSVTSGRSGGDAYTGHMFVTPDQEKSRMDLGVGQQQSSSQSQSQQTPSKQHTASNPDKVTSRRW